MKRLRILTGLHAGVSVLLAAGRTVIGGGEDADVLVSDWNDDDLVLFIDEPDQVFVVRETPDPRDPEREMVCAALLGSEAGLASTRPHPYPPELAVAQLRHGLSAAGLGDLTVQVRGDTLQQSGYVPNGSADVTTRNIVAGHTDIRIAPRYHVATSDAHTIAQTIGQPGVRVAYSGDGVFTVTGTVPLMARFEADVQGESAPRPPLPPQGASTVRLHLFHASWKTPVMEH